MTTAPETDDPDDIDAGMIGDECWNCLGEGVTYSCEQEFACADPDSGCEWCERRCWVCQPSRPAVTP